MTRFFSWRRLRPLRVLVAALALSALVAPAALAHGGDDDDHRLIGLASGVATVSVSGAGVDGTRAATVCTTKPSGWAQALAGSQWIGSVADCTTQPVGEQRYTVTFSLPSDLSALDHLRLAGAVLSDDNVTVQLNGTTIFSGAGWEEPDVFGTTDRALFKAGDNANTLTFIVNNTGGPGGIDFVAAVRAGAHDDDDDDGDAINTAKQKCKNGGWAELGYRNQGQCVSAAVRHNS